MHRNMIVKMDRFTIFSTLVKVEHSEVQKSMPGFSHFI